MHSRFAAPLLRCLHWLTSPSAGLLWSVVALLSLTGVIVMLVQHFCGLPFQTQIRVGPNERIAVYREGTGTYRWRLPSRYNNLVMDYRAVMLEDGRPMSQCFRNADITDIKATHFYVHNSAFVFGTGDGSDVRTNGRRYEVRLPSAVRGEWLISALAVLTLALTLSVRAGAGQCARWRWLLSLPVRLPAWTVALTTLAVTFGDLAWEGDRTLGAMLVKGLPESDSAGWLELGQRLAEGRGLDTAFGAQRPFYAIYLAALSIIGGPSLLLAKGFNAVLMSLTAMGVFLLGRAMRCAWAGLGTAAYVVLAEDHRHTVQTMLTENPGLALGVLSGLTLVWALWRRSTWGCALAGIVIGLCSLSSGELILAVPINAILMASLGLFGVIPFKRCVRLTLAFTVGTSIMLLPWMALQKARFGIFTLTMNTPELLAGGSDPVHGKLDRALHAEANALGLDVTTAANLARRYHYFSERFASQVKADPLGYIWRVLNASRESLADIRSNDPLIRLLIPLSVLGAGVLGVFRWRAPQPLLLSGALVLFLANEDDPWPAHWLTALIAALATCRWRGRRLLALGAVASTLIACMLLCGLSGNVASRRFWNVADWAIVLLWVVGAAMTLRLIFAGVAKVPVLGWGMARQPQGASLTRSGGRLRECMPLAVIVSTVSIVALGIVLFRHQIGPRPAYSPASVATIKSTVPGGNEEVQLVKFDDFTITLGRWEHAAHWRPYYYTARESRWLARPRLIQADGNLGSRVIVEAPLSQLPPPPAWEPMVCIGKTTMMTDPISGAPVGVLRVSKLIPAKLETAR